MESGGGGGFSYGNTNNNFHYYDLQNQHSLFQETSFTTAIDRFLWSDYNNQISQYPHTTNPLNILQNNGTPSFDPNNIVVSPNAPLGWDGNRYHQNGGVHWPIYAELNFSSGQLLNKEQINWNEQENILANLRKDLDLSKKNGELGKNGKPGHLCLIKQGQWTKEEDRKLIELVNKHGDKKWTLISDGMNGRAGKQCRERWHNHLRSNIKKEPWSEAEERLLVETHKKLDSRWTEIARTIPGRTENSIKNHWNATKRKLDSRKRGNRRHNPNEKKLSTILQDYIMNYYAKNTKSTSSFPETITPSIGTSEAMPTSINPNDPYTPSASTTLGNMSTNFDMFLADISDSIIDPDAISSSMLTYDQDQLTFTQRFFAGNASADSTTCVETNKKVGSTEQQLIRCNMMNGFYGLSSYMDSNNFINNPNANNWNVHSTRPGNFFDNGVGSGNSL